LWFFVSCLKFIKLTCVMFILEISEFGRLSSFSPLFLLYLLISNLNLHNRRN
jgi:hypothetical protein